MRILFIETPAPYLVRQHVQLPLGLLMLATVVENDGHEVKFIRPMLKEDILEHKDYDIICFGGTTLEFPMNEECVKLIRENFPNTKVFIGGVHASSMYKEIEESKVFDSICVGEGENLILEMVNDVEKNELKSIYFMKEYVKDLDSLPFINYDLVETKLGKAIFFDEQEGNSVNFLTSRGCPFNCLRGDTLIETIEGRIPIKDLVGRDIKVLTRNLITGNAEFAQAYNISLTKQNAELVRVNFDDGTHIDCTPDHKFMTFKNGNQHSETTEKEIEAQHLQPKMTVRAIKYETTAYNYIDIVWGRRKCKKLHRLIMEGILNRKLTSKEEIHHKDKNRNNNSPLNLIYCKNKKEHQLYHPEVSERMRNDNPAKHLAKEHFIKLGKMQKEKKRSLESRIKYSQSKLGMNNPNYKDGQTCGKKHSKLEINHKIVSVTKLAIKEDTYCMEVPGYNWFYANQVLVHNCSFCASQSMWTRRVRFRSIDNIIEEMKLLKEKYNINQFRLADDNLTSNKRRCLEFCKAIKELNVFWRCSIRAESITPEVANAMHDAGAREISPGIENLDQRVLDFLHKDTTIEKMYNGCLHAQNAGLKVRGLFMTGIPGEQMDSPSINEQILKTFPIDYATLSTFIPLPGTAIFKDPDEFNCEILSTDFNKYNKDFYQKIGEEAIKRDYAPLIHNKFLTINEQKWVVSEMERVINIVNVNKG